jgi:hypothetical protein
LFCDRLRPPAISQAPARECQQIVQSFLLFLNRSGIFRQQVTFDAGLDLASLHSGHEKTGAFLSFEENKYSWYTRRKTVLSEVPVRFAIENRFSVLNVNWFSIAKLFKPGRRLAPELEGTRQSISRQFVLLERTERSVI